MEILKNYCYLYGLWLIHICSCRCCFCKQLVEGSLSNQRQYVKACTMAAWLPAKCSSQALQRLVRASTPLRADYVHSMNVPGARRGKSLQNTEPHHPEQKGDSQIEDVAQCSTLNISIGSQRKTCAPQHPIWSVKSWQVFIVAWC